MLKRIELWDYESHEHTVVNDLSPYLNLICGESNCGKSAIVRALRLVAFNQFEPDSVRVGAKFCMVEVESDKGKVKVTRGDKKNIWEVTKNGEPTQTFSAIGKNILPEVEEVLGLYLVKLGDIEIAANIMDQLEKHFMLVELEGQKAAGSVRAQIIDEISGLSGIETVIREVSLDGTRLAREIKQTEAEVNDNLAKMHDNAVLERRQRILNKIAKLLDDYDMTQQKIRELKEIQGRWFKGRERLLELTEALGRCRDTDKAQRSVETAYLALQRMAECNLLLGKLSIRDRIEGLRKKLSLLPDVSGIDIDAITNREEVIKMGKRLLVAWGTKNRELEAIREALSCLPDGHIDSQKITEILHKLEELKVCWGKIQELSLKSMGLKKKVDDLQVRMIQEVDELNEILMGVQVCPLTNLPLTEACYKGIQQVKDEYEKSNRS